MEHTTQQNKLQVKWYHFIAAFFAGVFLVNAIPHGVSGMTGNPFPTPFADPPGEGLSSPVMNVIWAIINFVIGFVLYRIAKVRNNWIILSVIIIGGSIMAVFLASHFGEWWNNIISNPESTL